MTKTVKRVVWICCAILLFLAFFLIIHPVWVGPTGACVARSIVPDMTKSEFGLESLGVNLYSGKVGIDGLSVKNPGDANTEAIGLKALKVELSTVSMLTNERHINEIVIDGLKINGDKTFSNLRQIVANINEYVGEEKEEPEKSEARMVIDRILITGTEFKWGVVKIALPDIELKDIGKEEPVDGEGAFSAIVDAVCAAADKVAVGLGKALKIAIEGGGLIVDGIKAVSGAVTDVAGDLGGKAAEVGGKAVDGLKSGLDGVKGLFK